MKDHMFFRIWGPSQASQSQNGEDVSNGIGGQEFSRGFRGFSGSSGFSGFRGNGVRSCSSDPPFHAQESQDDVSSQANSLK